MNDLIEVKVPVTKVKFFEKKTEKITVLEYHAKLTVRECRLLATELNLVYLSKENLTVTVSVDSKTLLNIANKSTNQE